MVENKSYNYGRVLHPHIYFKLFSVYLEIKENIKYLQSILTTYK